MPAGERMLKHAVYPSLGEGLRFFVAAFDLRSRADKRACDRMDRAAVRGDFDLELFDELVPQLLHAPLNALGDPQFGLELAGFVRAWRTEYIRYVGLVSADALTRQDLLPLLVEHFFAGWAADFLNHLERRGMIRSAALLVTPGYALDGKPQINPVGMVLETFLWEHGQPAGDVPAAFYPPRDDGDRDRGSEQVARWMSGIQLPSLTSIRSVHATARSRDWYLPGKPRDALVLFQRNMLVARALQYAAREAASFCDLLALIRTHQSSRQTVDLGILISRAVHLRGSGMEIAKIGLVALHALAFSTPRTPNDLEHAQTLLQEFEARAEVVAAPWAIEWMLTWCRARLAAWQGNFEGSLELYEHAFSCAVYRAGSETQGVLLEALTVACALRKRPSIKRFFHQARALNIVPPILGNVMPEIRDPDVIVDLLMLRYLPHFPDPRLLFGYATPVADELGL